MRPDLISDQDSQSQLLDFSQDTRQSIKNLTGRGSSFNSTEQKSVRLSLNSLDSISNNITPIKSGKVFESEYRLHLQISFGKQESDMSHDKIKSTEIKMVQGVQQNQQNFNENKMTKPKSAKFKEIDFSKVSQMQKMYHQNTIKQNLYSSHLWGIKRQEVNIQTREERYNMFGRHSESDIDTESQQNELTSQRSSAGTDISEKEDGEIKPVLCNFK